MLERDRKNKKQVGTQPVCPVPDGHIIDSTNAFGSFFTRITFFELS